MTAPITDGIATVAKNHDIFLLDMWGVMHDGAKPYAGVLETVRRLKEAGKELVILSNSSKRKENSIKMLNKLGFNPDDFAQIITSGEVSFQMLSGDESMACGGWDVLNSVKEKKVFVFGSGSDDEEYCTSAGWTLAPIAEANLIVARGTFTICDGISTLRKQENEENYLTTLQDSLRAAAERRVPMLVTNPDKVRPDEGLPPMPGAIADTYAEIIGDSAAEIIRRVGKPFPEVYQLALGDRDPSTACMVGDALETDVTGGSQFGLTTVWVVKDGIHGPCVDEKGGLEKGTGAILQEFNSKENTYANGRELSPTIIVPHFQW